MMRGPLDVFEQIHICGKQVASKFYDTREDIKAEAEDIEPEAEDAMQDSDHWVVIRPANDSGLLGTSLNINFLPQHPLIIGTEIFYSIRLA